MPRLIGLNDGINTIGNYTSKPILAQESLSDSNIQNAKTLINQQWKSWDKVQDEAFLGFNSLEPGRGYVINTTGVSSAKLPDDAPMIIWDVPAIVGDNMLAFPLNNVKMDVNPRVEADVFRRVEATRWKSYLKNAEDEFQGFLLYVQEQGYYVKVKKVMSDILPEIKSWVTDQLKSYQLIQGMSGYARKDHNHDDRYVTQTEFYNQFSVRQVYSNQIDLTWGNYFVINFSNGSDIRFLNVPILGGGAFRVFFIELRNAANYYITWPSGIIWNKGVAPTFTSNKRDILGFMLTESNTIFGFRVGKDLPLS